MICLIVDNFQLLAQVAFAHLQASSIDSTRVASLEAFLQQIHS